MKYICQVCGYVYDEAAEACPFDQLPDSWQCPWCKGGVPDSASMQDAVDSGWKSHTERN